MMDTLDKTGVLLAIDGPLAVQCLMMVLGESQLLFKPWTAFEISKINTNEEEQKLLRKFQVKISFDLKKEELIANISVIGMFGGPMCQVDRVSMSVEKDGVNEIFVFAVSADGIVYIQPSEEKDIVM